MRIASNFDADEQLPSQSFHPYFVFMRTIAVALLALCLPWVAPGLPQAEAQDVVAPDVAIQKVIDAQLDALAHDDAAKALSFATPQIRNAFDKPEQFLAMVESGYPMVYRHTSVRFVLLRVGYRMSLQIVRMADLQGNVWMVAYRLIRQSDGGWLIGSVSAFPSDPVPDLLPPSPES